MLYVPDNTYSCYVVYDRDTIRAYHTNPNYNSTIAYTDYYVNSHYMEREGSQTFSNYSTLPTCIDSLNLTTDFYYRNDLADILIIFSIIVIFGFILPWKIISRFWKRLR